VWHQHTHLYLISRTVRSRNSLGNWLTQLHVENCPSISVNLTALLLLLPLHCVSKNVPPLVCCNFDIHECIWIFFDRYFTDKVSNQKALYYATSNNVCFCTTWQNGETQKSHFFTQMLYQCIARIQPDAPWFLQSFWLMTHTHAAVWLPKLVINAFSSGLLGGMV